MMHNKAKQAVAQARKSLGVLQARIDYFQLKQVPADNQSIEGKLAQVKAWEAIHSPWACVQHPID